MGTAGLQQPPPSIVIIQGPSLLLWDSASLLASPSAGLLAPTSRLQTCRTVVLVGSSVLVHPVRSAPHFQWGGGCPLCVYGILTREPTPNPPLMHFKPRKSHACPGKQREDDESLGSEWQSEAAKA